MKTLFLAVRSVFCVSEAKTYPERERERERERCGERMA